MRAFAIALASASLLIAPAGALDAQTFETQTAPGAPPMSDAGNQPPGGLSPRDVIGKHLNDVQGRLLGQIVGVSRDGTAAEVRPAGGGAPILVSMAELSLGTGAHTVIKGAAAPSHSPNSYQPSGPGTWVETPPTVIVQPQ